MLAVIPTAIFVTMKAGILGGGQLGRMLLQAAINYPVETFVLENDEACPSAHLCHHFIKGNINDFDAVLQFGRQVDVLTIEIESVNVDALKALEAEGVKVIPNSKAIATFKNKILQKNFYKNCEIGSPEFVITQHAGDLQQHSAFLPAVHKLATGGYDGRGVQVIKDDSFFNKGFDEPSVLEKMVSISKEISVLVARGANGAIAVYPPVEMFFDEALNQLSFQLSPANIDGDVLWKAEALAQKVVEEINSPGIFAVEMFIDTDNKVWVNETAPRVHNSGHHTIEASYCSQFDMLWRIMLGYPLGNPKAILPSAMVNIAGVENSHGEAFYPFLNEVLQLDNAFVHLYGKKESRAGRKLGHITLLSHENENLIHLAKSVRRIIS